MIATIVRKEMKELVRDGRFRWAGGLVAALLAASCLAGWKHHLEVRTEREAAQRTERRLWLDKGEMNPHSAAHYGAYVFKPAMPLAALDPGLDSFLGVAIYLEAHKQNGWRFKPAEDQTAVQRLGELTAATTLQILVPLLIVLLGFSSLAGEREAGTLRQLLASGVPPRRLLLGKLLGTAVPLALLLTPATLLGVLAMALNRGSGVLLASAPRLVLMAAVHLAYFAVWLAVTFAVSSRPVPSRFALVVLVGFWFVTTLVAPRLLSGVSRAVHPAPTAGQLAARIEADRQALPDWDTRVAAIDARLRRRYGAATGAALPVNPQGVALEESEADDTAIYDRHFGGLQEIYERQNRFYQLGALVSPRVAVQSLSMALAGTDLEQHRLFNAAAERYRRALVSTMNGDVTAQQKQGAFDYKAGRALWERVPAFEYEPPGAARVLEGNVPALALLGFWVIATFALAPLAAWGIRP